MKVKLSLPDDTKELLDEIYMRADRFVEDNLENPSKWDYYLIRSAILIGTRIGIEWESKKATEIAEEVWKKGETNE